jgi:hypothetical protein
MTTKEPGVALLSLIGVQGILELAGGFLILIGLFTRPVAFILAGDMAVAYFMAHAPKDFFPTVNGGQLAILFCFVFLYLVVAIFVAPDLDRWGRDHVRADLDDLVIGSLFMLLAPIYFLGRMEAWRDNGVRACHAVPNLDATHWRAGEIGNGRDEGNNRAHKRNTRWRVQASLLWSGGKRLDAKKEPWDNAGAKRFTSRLPVVGRKGRGLYTSAFCVIADSPGDS